LGYAPPLGLTALVYTCVWLTGLGRFSPADLASSVSSKFGVALNPGVMLVSISFAVTATLVVVLGALTALGEELGWRGFLVPELVRSTSFHGAAIISGGIWAAWHAPLIVFADYNAGTPAWFSVACFSAMVVSVGVVLAWLRLRSGSLWPAVLLHASHNAFIQNILDPATASTGLTPYVTTEFGLGLALLWFGVAAYLWQRQPTGGRQTPPINASDREERSVAGSMLILDVSA
jgi:membrane protease YdiL (CAAX protease family)